MDVKLKKKSLDLEDLLEALPESVKSMDDQFYLLESLARMFDMCSDCSQREFKEDVPFYETSRVVKFNKVVPTKILDKVGVEYLFLGGVFALMPVAIISKELMANYFGMMPMTDGRSERERKFHRLYDPMKDLGFPSGYKYESLKVLPNGFGIVLKDNFIIDNYIYYARNYDYLWIK